jgi:hypothetical protein
MNYIFIASLLLFSCCKEKEDTRELMTLRHNLRFILHENQRSIKMLEIRQWGDPAAEPYYHIADSLNKFLLQNIDTDFVNVESDSNKIKMRMKKISDGYLAIYTSMANKPTTRFLDDDDSVIRRPIASFRPLTRDKLMNHYLLLQDMLFAHMNMLDICRGCFGVRCRFGWDEMEGFQINTLLFENETKVKCRYNYPKQMASYELVDFIDVKDNNGRSISVKDLERTDNDTLKFTLASGTPSHLTIHLLFDITNRNGYEYRKKIEFPLGLW